METADTNICNGNTDLNFPFLKSPLPEQIPFTLESKSTLSFYSSVIYGNKKNLFVKMESWKYLKDSQYFTPNKWTYLYDHSPLVKTSEKYIDYSKLQLNGKPKSRLIITAFNVMAAEPPFYDSA